MRWNLRPWCALLMLLAMSPVMLAVEKPATKPATANKPAVTKPAAKKKKENVKLTAAPIRRLADNRYRVKLLLEIDSKFHIHANPASKALDWLVSSEVRLLTKDGVRVPAKIAYPRGIVKESILGDFYVYEDKAEIVVTFDSQDRPLVVDVVAVGSDRKETY